MTSDGLGCARQPLEFKAVLSSCAKGEPAAWEVTEPFHWAVAAAVVSAAHDNSFLLSPYMWVAHLILICLSHDCLAEAGLLVEDIRTSSHVDSTPGILSRIYPAF